MLDLIIRNGVICDGSGDRVFVNCVETYSRTDGYGGEPPAVTA